MYSARLQLAGAQRLAGRYCTCTSMHLFGAARLARGKALSWHCCPRRARVYNEFQELLGRGLGGAHAHGIYCPQPPR